MRQRPAAPHCMPMPRIRCAVGDPEVAALRYLQNFANYNCRRPRCSSRRRHGHESEGVAKELGDVFRYNGESYAHPARAIAAVTYYVDTTKPSLQTTVTGRLGASAPFAVDPEPAPARRQPADARCDRGRAAMRARSRSACSSSAASGRRTMRSMAASPIPTCRSARSPIPTPASIAPDAACCRAFCSTAPTL